MQLKAMRRTATVCATDGYAKNCFATVILSANVKHVTLDEGALTISHSQSEEPISRKAHRAFIKSAKFVPTAQARPGAIQGIESLQSIPVRAAANIKL